MRKLTISFFILKQAEKPLHWKFLIKLHSIRFLYYAKKLKTISECPLNECRGEMNPVEFSELESVSLCLWDEIQTVKKSVGQIAEAVKSGAARCSSDFASIRGEVAKIHGIIKWGCIFLNIKGVNDRKHLY